MKTIKRIIISVLCLVLCLTAAACERPDDGGNGGDTTPGYAKPADTTQYYNNSDFNEFLKGNDATIKEQWEGYGIGDPFVMRWNGMYYLYVSTLDSEYGVRAYKSADLVNWTQCTGEGLDMGYVAQEPLTQAAYAPEVYYFNGVFYMYTSPGGNGHYVLTATHPEGPFKAVTGNIGLSIDGSVLIDDDETAYFSYADRSGIFMQKMTSLTQPVEATLLNNTSIGGWTEGSYILKRDGIYYLTYTGNHVASDGYRISYATADSIANAAGNVNRNAFSYGINNPIALSTETEMKGIGHSSTVMGPDMDSYYLAYHILNSSGGPNRSLGIDRLLFNGKQMSVAPMLNGSVKPSMPAFSANGLAAEKFDTANAAAVSKQNHKADFSAEYNFKGSDSVKFAFNYTDAQNYQYAAVDFTQKSVTLNSVVAGADTNIKTGTLVNSFSVSDLHTVRVSVRDGIADVVFDNMTKIKRAEIASAGGKIAYIGTTDLTVSYTAFSDTAKGVSDENEVKQAQAYIGASNYYSGDKYCEPTKLSAGSEIKIDDSDLDGAKYLTLAVKNDYANYLVNFDKAGCYALEMIYPKADGGKKIGVRFANGDVQTVTLPEVATSELYVKAKISDFTVVKGAQVVRLESLADSPLSFFSFRFYDSVLVSPSYAHNLETYAETGADYKTIWKIKDGGHYAKAAQRQLVYFGNNSIADFTLEVDMMLEGTSGVSGSAGIVFHAQNYAASSHDNYMSLQGYYLSANNSMLSLQRLNFSDNTRSLEAAVSTANPFAQSNVFVTLKIQMRGNTVTVYANGETVFSFTDNWSFTSGKIGLYTNGAAVIYKNLKITP